MPFKKEEICKLMLLFYKTLQAFLLQTFNNCHFVTSDKLYALSFQKKMTFRKILLSLSLSRQNILGG